MNKRFFIFLLLVWVFPEVVLAAPGKPSVSVDGSTLTITGSSFGSTGPEIEVWDNFDDGALNDPISDDADWDDAYPGGGTGAQPVYESSNGRTNSTYHAHMSMPTPSSTSGIYHDGMTLGRYVYLDFWIHSIFTDQGSLCQLKTWRLCNQALNNEYPTLKYMQRDFTALLQGDSSTGSDCDDPSNRASEYTGAFPKNQWVHVRLIVDSGTVGTSNANFDLYYNSVHEYEASDFEMLDNSSCLFHTFRIGWWFSGTCTSSNTHTRADDIYISDGWARVVVSESNTWNYSDHHEIQIPSAWADTSITATANQGTFDTETTVYLYVIDSNGDVSPASDGFTFQGGDTTPPVVTGYDPAKSETGVAKDTNIEFIVYDAANDVDLDTIVMTEESNYHCCTGMTGTCPGSGTKNLTCTDYSVLGDGYTVVYNPGVDYSYEQVVNVTIDADDTEANSMTQDVYSFTIESEPQTALTILKGSGNAWRFNGKKWTLE